MDQKNKRASSTPATPTKRSKPNEAPKCSPAYAELRSKFAFHVADMNSRSFVDTCQTAITERVQAYCHWRENNLIRWNSISTDFNNALSRIGVNEKKGIAEVKAKFKAPTIPSPFSLASFESNFYLTEKMNFNINDHELIAVVDMNNVLANDVIEYKKLALQFGFGKITQQVGMAILLLKVTETHYILLDGQRRFICDGGIVTATVLNPHTSFELIKNALDQINLKTNLKGEISWVQQIRVLGQCKKTYPNQNKFKEAVQMNGFTRSLASKDYSSINKRLRIHDGIHTEVLDKIERYLLKCGSNSAIPWTFVYQMAVHSPPLSSNVQEFIIDSFIDVAAKKSSVTQSEYKKFIEDHVEQDKLVQDLTKNSSVQNNDQNTGQNDDLTENEETMECSIEGETGEDPTLASEAGVSRTNHFFVENYNVTLGTKSNSYDFFVTIENSQITKIFVPLEAVDKNAKKDFPLLSQQFDAITIQNYKSRVALVPVERTGNPE